MNAKRCPSLGYDLGFQPLGYDLWLFRGSDECQRVFVIRIQLRVSTCGSTAATRV